ncbi:MAG: T9SS type A sorting domain-containing protein [Bacteroidia bacterium]
MNDRFIFIIAFLFSFSSLNAQHQWARQSAGQGVDSRDIATDLRGNVYAFGDFTGTVMWGTHTLVQDNTVNTEGPSFLTRYDTDGNAVWVRGIKGKSSNNGNAVATDAAGNVYVCGEYDQTNSFSNLDFGNGITLDGNPSSSLFLAKADSFGTFHWAERILATDAPGSQRITAKDILVSGADIYITGEVLQAVTVGGNSYNTTNGDKAQLFIAKYDTSGNFQWFKHTNRVGDFGTAGGSCIYAGKNGNIYVTGTHNKFSVTWDSDTFGVYPQTSNAHLFIGCFDSDGNMLWHRWAATSSNGAQQPHPSGVDSDGNITTTIRVMGSTVLADTTFFETGTERFLLRLDAQGNRVFLKPMYTFSGFSGPVTQIHALYTQGDGITFVTGAHVLNPIIIGNDTLPADPGGISQWNFFAAYDNQGNPIDARLWADEYLASFNEFEIAGICGDPQGNVFVTGKMEGAAKIGNDTLDQMFNMFLVKTRPDGFFNLSTDIYDELTPGRSFRIFPNPAAESVWLEYEPQKAESIQIRMENLQGQIIWREEKLFSPGAIRQQITLPMISSGIYIVRFQHGNTVLGVEKIIISR